MKWLTTVFWALSSFAFATDVSGDVSGSWSSVNNPYRLVGDIRVPPGQTLTVNPGVQVISTGYFKLTVDNGARLLAKGSKAAPILWTATNQATGWRGIRMLTAQSDSIVDYCTFEYAKGTGDWPEVQGGALTIRNCSPTVQNSTFQFNYSHNANFNGVGAGVLLETSNSIIQNNVFKNNTCDSGAGVCAMEYGTAIIRGNLFESNTSAYAGGGIYLGARNSSLVEGNRFFRNSSGGYGGGAINSWTSYVFYNTFPVIRNNVIARNTAATGGGIYCRYDRAIITNNTIVNNNGHGIFALNFPEQAPIVGNCIVWGNTSAQIGLEVSTGSAINVTYSNVQGGYSGGGNINLNPFFLNSSADDYRLGLGSSCVDAGNNGYMNGILTDVAGAARFVDDPKKADTGVGPRPVIDMGAFERPGLFFTKPIP